MSDGWYDLYKHKTISLYIVGTPEIGPFETFILSIDY